jgi:hypothetical protein
MKPLQLISLSLFLLQHHQTVMLRACQPLPWRLSNLLDNPLLKQTASASSSWRKTYATLTDLSNYPKPGEQLHGFTLRNVQHLPELEMTALHLQHDKTGAEYLHVARDDPNNVFSIGFKTNPPDSTGVPHILEHITLCGSKK